MSALPACNALLQHHRAAIAGLPAGTGCPGGPSVHSAIMSFTRPCACICVQTTLLSLLGGRAPKRTQQDGRVTFNGSRLNKRVKRQIGFVLQDDLLYATLTVQETLYFAAMLRLPKHKTKAQKVWGSSGRWLPVAGATAVAATAAICCHEAWSLWLLLLLLSGRC